MFPVLFTIGSTPVSSFGVFLALGFLFGVFLIWRLSRAWDLDEEKVLDLTLLTFLGGLLGARFYFVLENLSFFSQNLLSIVIFNKYPGFSFWGAFLGGWLTLYFVARTRNLDFWQIGDIASVGFLGGLVFSSLGCFLGGCSVGIKSNLPFAVNMVGSAGGRFPVQLLEAILLIIILSGLWVGATHFHQRGKILALSLIYLGSIKLLTLPLKDYAGAEWFLSAVLVFLGINILYRVTKRSIISDLRGFAIFAGKLITDSKVRKDTLARIQKYWYNQTTLISWKLRNFKKNLRRFNVRF